MTDLIQTRKYPAQGLQKIEFFGDPPLPEDFDMVGLIVSISLNTTVEDFKLIYSGGIEIENEDGTISHPNRPFFMFDIDGKRLLSVPVCSIPCTRYKVFSCGTQPMYQDKSNGHSIPLSIKKGQRIDAMIKYPLHKVPLPSGKDNSFRVQLICG